MLMINKSMKSNARKLYVDMSFKLHFATIKNPYVKIFKYPDLRTIADSISAHIHCAAKTCCNTMEAYKGHMNEIKIIS